MLDSRQGRILLGVLLLAVAAIAITLVAVKTMPASAQMPPPPRDGDMPAPMGPEQPGGWGYSGPGMVQPPPAPSAPRYSVMSPGGGQVAVSATADYVYVVQGNTLYQFSAKTLKQVNKAELAAASSTRPVYPMNPGPGGMAPAPGN